MATAHALLTQQKNQRHFQSHHNSTKGFGNHPCGHWAPPPGPVCFGKCFRWFGKSISKIRKHVKLGTLAGISTGIKGSSAQNPLGSSANNHLCTLHLTAFFFPSAKFCNFFSLQQKIPGPIKKADITGNNVFTTLAGFCHEIFIHTLLDKD